LLLLLRLQLMRERCAAVADHASPARRSRTGASSFESVARFAVQARASRAVASKLSLSLSLSACLLRAAAAAGTLPATAAAAAVRYGTARPGTVACANAGDANRTAGVTCEASWSFKKTVVN